MNNQEIEKALRLCAEGAKEKMTKCHLCPYARAGCLASLLKDTSLYITRLKVQQKNSSSVPQSSPQSASPYPRKNGKPVQQWLREHAEEDLQKFKGGNIPW